MQEAEKKNRLNKCNFSENRNLLMKIYRTYAES